MAAIESPTESHFNQPSGSMKVPNFVADQQMNQQLLKACNEGDLELLEASILDDPNVLMSVTPYGNNCLHLAAMFGYHEFAKEIWSRKPSLFSATNKDGETPLVAALMAANATLATDMINAATEHLQPDTEGRKPLNEMLLKSDMCGDSVLHHAMRNNFEDLAVVFLDIEPLLSEQVNNINESPMHMAARRGYSKVLDRLLNIPSSADSGPGGYKALHAAVEAGRTDILAQLLKGLPEVAYHEAENCFSLLVVAVMNGYLEIVKILLEHNPNLAYVSGKGLENPFLLAACNGSIPIAEEIIRVCPDAAYSKNEHGHNALHLAIFHEQTDFVDYILQTPRFHRFVNQAASVDGHLPLHAAADCCNPKLLHSLLNYTRQDHTAVNCFNQNAVDIVSINTKLTKTLKWNESYTLLSGSMPNHRRYLAINQRKRQLKEKAIDEVKSLTERYTTNTSLVAALLATITFAAAFTLPGGYISDTSDAGLSIFAMKTAFQVFLISDTIAMCSSLAVTFLCVLATWEDLDFLLNYRKTTRALMWCAYVTTVVAFGTGLFTVVAPKNKWLAIFILILSSILPFVSKIISEWPLLKLRLRLGGLYRKDLIPNI